MTPAAREIEPLNTQLDQSNHFLAKLEARQTEVEAVASDGENLVSDGHAPDAQSTREQLETLRKQATRLEDRGKARVSDLEKTLGRMESFYDLFGNIMTHINEVLTLPLEFLNHDCNYIDKLIKINKINKNEK